MEIKRRSLLQNIAAAATLLPLPGTISSASAQPLAAGRKLLLRGGYVTCDKAIGEIKAGDVLIIGSKVEVGTNLPVTDAEVIDATNKLVRQTYRYHRHTGRSCAQ
jgi:hypothetical protein